jgi:hypothetical protein
LRIKKQETHLTLHEHHDDDDDVHDRYLFSKHLSRIASLGEINALFPLNL